MLLILLTTIENIEQKYHFMLSHEIFISVVWVKMYYRLEKVDNNS